MQRLINTASVLALALLILPLPNSAAPMRAKRLEPVAARLIVKFREAPRKHTSDLAAPQRVAAMSLQTGVGMQIVRPLSGGAQLVGVDRPMAPAELRAMAQKLSHQPGIEYADPDVRLYPQLAPNDPAFGRQYYFKDAAVEPGAINAPPAWTTTTGSTDTVIAILDTGIRPEHIDIAGRLVPGYDFISANPEGGFFDANDGDGRDSDPADPGDGVAGSACGPGDPQTRQASSWHGTRVTSLIGAITNNGLGMASANWNAQILPVRVLGRCGAYLSDVIDATSWAAGLPVPGVPPNPNPARIINLSFAAFSVCTQSTQAAVDAVTAAGALIVAAAGNGFENALRNTPANCAGVLPIAATSRNGGLAPFSNFGPKVGLSAPGVGVLTATNTGTQGPVANGSTYNTATGTSFSSPLVAGVASLMLSLNPDLAPQQLVATLRASARAFPPIIGRARCNNLTCGAGLLDAAAAVNAVAMGNIAVNSDGGNGLRAAFAKPVPLASGTPHRGALTRTAQFDVYKISLPFDGVLTTGTRGITDTYGYVFDARGRLLQQNDDSVSPRNLNFKIGTPLKRGVYYIAVEGFGKNTTGPYTLSAILSSPNAGKREAGGGGAAGGLLGILLLSWLFDNVVQRSWRRQRGRQ